MPPWSEFAAAKVNLHLHIVGRRDDGYHLLDSLVVFAAVGDRLTISPADDLSLVVTGPFAAGLQDESDNLVLRAARALAEKAGIRACGKLLLEKNLPLSSGIGGGSADAAAALRLLRRFWRLGPVELSSIAGLLGADVPVCLATRPALMSGIGDVLAPAPDLPDIGILLVNPGVAVSTQAVFRARIGAFSHAAQWPADQWRDAAALVTSLLATGNDLEPPACSIAPVIEAALEAVAGVPGCLLARMSGSGATCFGLFSTAAEAEAAARTIGRAGWWVWGGGLIGG